MGAGIVSLMDRRVSSPNTKDTSTQLDHSRAMARRVPIPDTKDSSNKGPTTASLLEDFRAAFRRRASALDAEDSSSRGLTTAAQLGDFRAAVHRASPPDTKDTSTQLDHSRAIARRVPVTGTGGSSNKGPTTAALLEDFRAAVRRRASALDTKDSSNEDLATKLDRLWAPKEHRIYAITQKMYEILNDLKFWLLGTWNVEPQQ